MQVKIFSIPILGEETQVEEMNKFLRSHRISEVKKELIQAGSESCWAFCITYLTELTNDNSKVGSKEKVDYREVLGEELYGKFKIMCELRNQIANEDAVPPYSVFYNNEVAEFVKIKNLTTAAMKKQKGIGEKRVEKYGQKLIDLYNEAQRQPDTGNSTVEQPADSLFPSIEK
ncbi:MAG: HRDC domain-containing protein [Paludibacteraceae bacterium]|nr:HRDC domain-containing protein [Paludibacteraceae bacterium]